jgi:hypothetical protein
LKGELWLGMNDDAASLGYSDNAGSLDVRVSVPDSGSTLALLSGGLAFVGLVSSRLRRQ